MSSGPKKQTIGYWYRLLYHFGLCKGPVDAFLEFRAGDRTAWRGMQVRSGRLSILQRNLWGGEKSEGGLEGDLDVMMGEPDQGPNDYLAGQLGSQQPTYRGKMSVVWRGGRWGAMNPYPKSPAFKVMRILKGWDNDVVWYPQKAPIGMIAAEPLALYFALDVSASMNATTGNGQTRLQNLQAAMNEALQFVIDVVLPSGGVVDILAIGWSTGRSNILRRNATASDVLQVKDFVSSLVPTGLTNFADGLTDMGWFFADAPAGSRHLAFFLTDGIPTDGVRTPEEIAQAGADLVMAQAGVSVYAINMDLADTQYTSYVDNTPEDGVPVISDDDSDAITSIIVAAMGGLVAMNPAHILYDSLTAQDMQGEPVAMIHDASFRAAADRLYAEGFGLCTQYDGGSIEEFQQRICDIVGACLTQSRVDGLYYLDLIRGDYTLGSLPVISSDDIVEFVHEPSILTEQPNQVTVEWFDPQQKENRTTAPLQALGAVQAAGRVIPETRTYREIPTEALALRVCGRDLQALATPLSRFRLAVNRRPFDIRPGRPFRLQYPEEGIADMVCLMGDVDSGTLTDGRIKIVAVQDVFSFSDSVYVEPEPGLAVPPSNLPVRSPYQLLLETPYVELVANMSRPDLAALPNDVGLLMTVATRPEAGLNYAIYAAAAGEDYREGGNAEWCPTALIVEEAGYQDTAFTLSSGFDLVNVLVGSWALWDSEVVRVDALNPGAGTITLGRGCADAVPAKHDAGSRIYFCGDWGGTDGREYVDGETVQAKLLTRTSSAMQPLTTAPVLNLVMAGRQFRPYPPAAVRINSQFYPETVSSPIGVAWHTRNRALQDDVLVDWFAASVTAEAGVTYDAVLKRVDTGAVLDAEYSLTAPAASLDTTYNGDVDLVVLSKRDGETSWQEFSHRFFVGTAYFSATPELRGGVSSFRTTNATTHSVNLPATYEAGDYLIVAISLPTTTFPAVPAGWVSLGFSTGLSDSGVAVDSLVRVFGKVADGTEGTALSVVNTVSTTFGSVALAVKKNTYTPPRGAGAVRGSLGTIPPNGVGCAHSLFSGTSIPHNPFYPAWGGNKAMYLSILARKQANADPGSYPYAGFQFSVSSDATTVPDTKICGESMELAPTLPVQPAAYSKSDSNSASTINLVIKGIFPIDRPECIYMQSASSGASTVTSLSLAVPSDTVVPVNGDLQILVLMMFGAGSVTITPPSGFTLVTKFGQRLAIYKRVIAGTETYPDAIGFSAAISVMANLYTLPKDTYADPAEVLVATASGASALTVATPSRAADSSWDGKHNYALRVIVREGVAGVAGNSVTAFPANCLENRAHGFNQGSAGARVSYTIAGGGVQNSSAPAETFTFGAGYPWEAATLFIKGI